ncbi:DUF1045 domain-containing protein [Azospirillum sp. TSO22-1]|uniref:DUF1045 domain-containing protein n=1 Tax=Azospirillum sp. TSO22-1 TaxID=716789 RepID=UPI000D61ED40|nr:DUF1045 domain-containing protein [Azospirillum sp. TSO22-1]PWC34934.1 hypothetical protein TSO221_30770 [Azospirillum sp. TSO22-1]
MSDRRRFALYFAPEDDTALARFGWWWLARRPDRAEPEPLPAVGLDPAAQMKLIAEPQRYGFHATLKAPFRLAEGTNAAALHDAAAAFARARRPFAEAPFALKELHGFLALRPSCPSPAIEDLAAGCVRAFERFRARPTEAERRRRLAAGLSDRQRDLYEAWGYPYVFEQFRFHMTLTRALPDAERAAIRDLLTDLGATARAEPVEFRSLCLFEQAGPEAPFVLTARFPFGG